MARFTSEADRHVPLLTQFYQLEVPPARDVGLNKVHLDAWLGAGLLSTKVCLRGAMSNPGKDGGIVIREDMYGCRVQGGDLWFWVFDLMRDDPGRHLTVKGKKLTYQGRIPEYPQHKDVERLARIHPVICNLMNCAADGFAPSRGDLEQFNSYRKAILAKCPRLEWGGISTPEGHVIDAIDTLEGESRVVRLVDRVLIDQLVQSVVAGATERSRGGASYRGVARCKECTNPFVLQKEGQQYCSQRCRSRVGERRRYALRMEGYPTKNKRPIIVASERAQTTLHKVWALRVAGLPDPKNEPEAD